MKPKVVVICLTYNHENFIKNCLEGFIKQKTDFPFFAIVHDDASTDKTAEIIKQYALLYSDIIKPVYERENQYSKPGEPLRNIIKKLIDESGARYIAFCEGDDYWDDPLKLQKQFEALETHSECTISVGKVATIDKNNNLKKEQIPHIKFDNLVSFEEFCDSQFKRGLWAFHTSTYFIRKEIYDKYIEAINSYLQDFPYDDLPIIMTALLNGKAYYIDSVLSVYRTFAGGYTSSMLANKDLCIKNEKKVIKAIRKLDKHTNFKYHDQLNFRILQGELKIARLTHNIRPLLRREFFSSYTSWGIYHSLKHLIPIFSPKIYKAYKLLFSK